MPRLSFRRPPITSTPSCAISSTRYAVDGVHLDYARYPTERFDYSRERRPRVPRRASVRSLPPPCAASSTARKPKIRSPIRTAFPTSGRRSASRALRHSSAACGRRSRRRVRSALVTVATAPDIQEARDHRLQDWAAWLQAGLVDAVCPMAYTPDSQRFAEQIAAARGRQGRADGLGRHRRLSHCRRRRRSRTSRPRAGSAPPASSSSPTTA